MLSRIDAGSTRELGTSGAQSALNGLQEAGLVWRSGRGIYALEEPRLAESMRREGLVDG